MTLSQEARPSEAPSVTADHVGRGAGLVQEHEVGGVHEALPDAPLPPVLGNIGAVLLGRSQGLFLRRSPIRCRNVWIAVRRIASPRRAASSALISASVMS